MKALAIIALALALEGGFLLTLAAQSGGEASRTRPVALASGHGAFAGHLGGAR